MTLVLAHGALGIWDEVIGLTLLVIALPMGVVFALLRGTSGRGTTPPGDYPMTTGQPPVVETTAKPASRIVESDDGSNAHPGKGERDPGQREHPS